MNVRIFEVASIKVITHNAKRAPSGALFALAAALSFCILLYLKECDIIMKNGMKTATKQF